MRLTNDIIEQGKSRRNGWSMKQLAVFGIFELKKGWRRNLIGREVSPESIARFLALKDKHLRAVETNQLSFVQDVAHDCKQCIHGVTESCRDTLPRGCEYFAQIDN